MFKKLALLMPVLLIAAGPVEAKEIKIGYVTTLTTPASLLGKQMKLAVEIALDHMNHKMGPLDVKVLFEDDAVNPKQGKQKTEKLLKKDKVDLMAGYIWSHVLGASAPMVLKAGKFFITSNAGHSLYAGKKCHKNFFSAAWENSQTPMAMGELLNRKGVKSLYVMTANYAAGKQMLAGVEATFKGKIIGKDLTPWPSHSDWSAELSKAKAAKPDGIFIFYPGAATAKYLTQYRQAGLDKTIPLYHVFSIDGSNLPLLQKAGLTNVLGTQQTQFWSPDLDNAQNKRFVAEFRKRSGGVYPAFYAAQAYDTMFLIKSGVEGVNGNLKDMDGMRAAMEKADFPSVRGKFRYGKNHFPIQNFYAREVVTDKDGNWTVANRGIVLKDHETPFAKDCKL
ncbi:MAG: ABC transporter substrate-binding protein [Rhodospirillaceae bacterium]|jgi:branched-chain amino acid transport system substrate-binding protein|nr:ABC transporter substrate-binding protein [Rhodospirillaceae bacterium]MBT3884356.1 ABC transporter substrate-binding protein [Rhodospirillaceae bacterium]MBT4117094.1 ABC transporter substrate-binding protein [Rhodospirillaceae bacterium]MBT4672877.1 ABC transporter substrate-binding protein [Rhodospirillaceae bacterium]MBT4721034.1 ABC transporter substrate-binding protein [Rhodospirillaceae bacterium]